MTVSVTVNVNGRCVGGIGIGMRLNLVINQIQLYKYEPNGKPSELLWVGGGVWLKDFSAWL